MFVSISFAIQPLPPPTPPPKKLRPRSGREEEGGRVWVEGKGGWGGCSTSASRYPLVSSFQPSTSTQYAFCSEGCTRVLCRAIWKKPLMNSCSAQKPLPLWLTIVAFIRRRWSHEDGARRHDYFSPAGQVSVHGAKKK